MAAAPSFSAPPGLEGAAAGDADAVLGIVQAEIGADVGDVPGLDPVASVGNQLATLHVTPGAHQDSVRTVVADDQIAELRIAPCGAIDARASPAINDTV